MRVLVEILHPAHVHFFRHAISDWKKRGDDVLVLSRHKDVATELLDAYGIEHAPISRLGQSKANLAWEMIVRDVRMFRRALSFRPDVLVGIMGVTIAQVGLLLRKPAVVFYDTENATITNAFVYPLAHSVCTPECYQGKVRGHHVTYPSYHELAYLHPSRFEPDAEVVRRAGIDPSLPYFIVRFVSWQASHDVGEQGFDLALKRTMVRRLEEKGRVLISSEGDLPEDLERLRFRGAPQDMHHFIAHARMLVGESATMASEAAVLGVPAFYIADTGRGYTDEEQERYGLVFNFKREDADRALSKLDELLEDPDLTRRMAEARGRLLSERICATDFVVDYVAELAGRNRA
jgi:hypothetical protein